MDTDGFRRYCESEKKEVRPGLEGIIKSSFGIAAVIVLAWGLRCALDYEFVLVKDFKYTPEQSYQKQGDIYEKK